MPISPEGNPYVNYKRMKKILIIFFLIIPLVQKGLSQRVFNRLADDHFEIVVQSREHVPVKILQVTDLHLGTPGKWNDDLVTFRRIKRLVEMYDPDIIAVTGDLFTGAKPFGSLLAAFAVEFFDGLERPWLYVFGNHDPEGGFGRDDIYEVFSASEWCILGYHSVEGPLGRKYDYLIDIKRPGIQKPFWQIYAFDSGAEKGFKSIKDNQIAWYQSWTEKTRAAYHQNVRAIAVFHIPLIQYQYLIDDKSRAFQGENREKVYYEEDDGRVYDAFLKGGNIEATFCGHDHYNNFWGKYKGGIILAYGFISGESTNYAWAPGGKLIELPEGKREIGIKNVQSGLPGNPEKIKE